MVADAETARINKAFFAGRDEMEAKYGGVAHRNAAAGFAKQRALDRGYSLVGDDFPPSHEILDAMELGYSQAHGGQTTEETTTGVRPRARTVRGQQPAVTERRRPREDISKTGRVDLTAEAPVNVSLEEATAQLKQARQGRELLLVDE